MLTLHQGRFYNSRIKEERRHKCMILMTQVHVLWFSSIPLNLHPFTFSMNKHVFQGICTCNRDIGKVFTRKAQQKGWHTCRLDWAGPGSGLDILSLCLSAQGTQRLDTRQDITGLHLGSTFQSWRSGPKRCLKICSLTRGIKEHSVVWTLISYVILFQLFRP